MGSNSAFRNGIVPGVEMTCSRADDRAAAEVPAVTTARTQTAERAHQRNATRADACGRFPSHGETLNRTAADGSRALGQPPPAEVLRDAGGALIAPGSDVRGMRNRERERERLAGARCTGPQPVVLRRLHLQRRPEDAAAVRHDVADGPPAALLAVAKLDRDA